MFRLPLSNPPDIEGTLWDRLHARQLPLHTPDQIEHLHGPNLLLLYVCKTE